MASATLQDGIENINPVPEIRRQYNNAGEPYVNGSQIISEVTQSIRYIGMTFIMADGTEMVFREGTADNQLVVKGVEAVIGIEDFLDQTLMVDLVGNQSLMGGKMYVEKQNTAFMELGMVPLPASFLGAQIMNCGVEADAGLGSVGIFLTDGGAGFFDGQYTNQWSHNLAMKVRAAVIRSFDDGFLFEFAFGLSFGLTSVSDVQNTIIYCSPDSPNWMIRSGATTYDTELPIVVDEWVDLRIDLLKNGQTILSINTYSIQLGVPEGVYLGPKALPIAVPTSEELRTVAIDTITIFKY